MLNILADSFIRATYQDRHVKPRWNAQQRWSAPRHIAPETPLKGTQND